MTFILLPLVMTFKNKLFYTYPPQFFFQKGVDFITKFKIIY